MPERGKGSSFWGWLILGILVAAACCGGALMAVVISLILGVRP